MERVNDVITESVRQIGDDRYMTATIMAFNGNGKCTFTGLHQDIIIYRAERDAIETVRTEGIWLGIHDDVRGLVSEQTLTMGKDDIMFLYTDGITEAWKEGSVRNIRDPQKDMYGIERLIRVFYESRALRPEEIRDAVLESLGGYACTDDITMVILRKL
jgi:serine phosphatase RsbU (regulator of sigma subunit)